MKKNNRHLHFLDMGIFPGTILFIHGFDYDDIIRILEKKKIKDWVRPLIGEKELIDNNEISLEKIQQAEREGRLIQIPITKGKTTLTWINDNNLKDGSCSEFEHERSFTFDLSKDPTAGEKSFWKKLFG